jgi:alkanesulfonate monooxygenase SsuD/methylene tetrahydromethanopterin reductase-like flavin-dependent oxidoreductase (luciferase family)
MRVGVTLSPTGDWQAILQAAKVADERGLDGVGFWDHYHSERPEWSYVCGWSAYGALAAATERIHLVPMVICNLNYTPGVLAKETSILSLASGGRFELGIGAGDYPGEYAAWHQPFPEAPARVARLEETVDALRRIWKGERVTYEGEHVRLTDAACTPAPPTPPRVVVGVGSSRRMVRSAVRYADELNVYADERAIEYARQQIAGSGRPIDISLYIHFNWDEWPDDLPGALRRWDSPDITRVFVNVGYGWDLTQRVIELAEAMPSGAARA